MLSQNLKWHGAKEQNFKLMECND